MPPAQDRLKEYKSKGADNEESRRRRNEMTVELRKNRRDEQLSKRRNMRLEEVDQENSKAGTDANAAAAPQISNLPQFVQMMNSAQSDERFRGVQSIRQLLSKAKSPPIDEVIASGCVPRLVEYLSAFENPTLQFESAWALTNISSGTTEHTKYVVDMGAVPIFIQLLSQAGSSETREQASWALGNICGDGPHYRDLCINSKVISGLFQLLNDCHQTLSIVRNCTWTMSNLCRGKKPYPAVAAVLELVPALAMLLTHDDTEVLTDALWALSYATDGASEQIEAVLQQTGTAARIAELCQHPQSCVVMPALRTCGNIVTGTDTQTQAMIDAGLINIIGTILSNPTARDNLRKEAAWALSNVTAGTQSQIQQVIDSNLVPPLLHVLSTGDFKTRKESAWAVCNAISGGTPEQLSYFVSQGCIKPLCEMLTLNDARIITVVLESLTHLLKEGEKDPSGENPICTFIENADGLDAIEQLQEHDNDDIYRKSMTIIEKFFGANEDILESLEPSGVSASGVVPTCGPIQPLSAFTFTAPAPSASGFSF